MTKFLIVRHGQSENNKEAKYTGHLDVSLSGEGRAQAEALGEYLEKNYKIDAIFSSDLKRAADTIAPYAEKMGLEIKKDADFREVSVGRWQGKTFEEVNENYKEEREKQRKNPGTFTFPGGESYKTAQKRVVSALLKAIKENEGKTIALATHGGIVRALFAYFMNKPIENLPDIPIVSNASVTEVLFENGEYKVLKFGFDEFLKNKTEAENI